MLLKSGGVGIAKKLFVGGDTNIAGTSVTGTIEPSATQTFNLGSADKRWQTVNAVEFRGNLLVTLQVHLLVVRQQQINLQVLPHLNYWR